MKWVLIGLALGASLSLSAFAPDTSHLSQQQLQEYVELLLQDRASYALQIDQLRLELNDELVAARKAAAAAKAHCDKSGKK